MRDDTNLMQFSLLDSLGLQNFVRLIWTFLVFEFPLAASETLSCLVLIYHLNLSHFQMCQYCKFSVGIFISSEGK